MTFGERLVELRKERGFTNRNDFANYIGMPSTTLRNYETNVREPGHIFLKQMADIFHVSLDYLLCMTDDKTPPIQQQGFSSEEYDHIKKYRIISEKDEDGKALVDSTVDYLCNRIKLAQEKDLRLSTLQEQLHIQKLHNRMCLYSYLGKIACAGTGFYFDDIPTDTIEVPYMEGADFIIGVSGESMEPTYHDGDKLYVQKINALTLGDEGIFTVRGECFVKELGERGLISRNPNYDDIEGTEDIRLIGRVLGKVEEV